MFTIALGLLATVGAEEVEKSVDVQVRPRLESHSGRDLVNNGSWTAVSQRSRITLGAARGAWQATAQFQDVRIWGTEENTLTDFSADTFDLQQGYVRWAGERASLKVGRFEVNMHEQRLIGAVDWTQQGRSFDGLHFKAGGGSFAMDAAAFVLASQVLDGRSADAGVVAVWGGYRPSDGPALVDLVYILGFDAEAGTTLSTTGLYAKGGAGILSGRVEGYAQFGGDDLQWMAGAQGTVAPEIPLKPTITLWYDALSSSGAGQGAFNTLFATNHKFYGLADIAWFRVGAHQDGRGLQDAALKVGLTPRPGTWVGVHGHLFLGTAEVDGLSNVIAQEIDVVGKVKLSDGAKLAAGGAFFSSPDGDAPEGWGFLQLDVNL